MMLRRLLAATTLAVSPVFSLLVASPTTAAVTCSTGGSVANPVPSMGNIQAALNAYAGTSSKQGIVCLTAGGTYSPSTTLTMPSYTTLETKGTPNATISCPSGIGSDCIAALGTIKVTVSNVNL